MNNNVQQLDKTMSQSRYLNLIIEHVKYYKVIIAHPFSIMKLRNYISSVVMKHCGCVYFTKWSSNMCDNQIDKLVGCVIYDDQFDIMINLNELITHYSTYTLSSHMWMNTAKWAVDNINLAIKYYQ